jgi:hypothetical protein
MKSRITMALLALSGAALAAGSAQAGSHTWRVAEVFSTPDGLIQFIELAECCGGTGEVGINGHNITSSTHSFLLPGPALTPPTSFRRVLIATQSFADLPNAPTPNYIIPANMIPFFNPSGDTVSYVAWHSWTFPAVPTDCVSSLHRDPSSGAVTTALASPTNYANQSHAIDACATPCIGDTNGSGVVDVDDLIAVILGWGCTGAKCAGDVNDSGVVDVDDLITVILHWGPC